MSIDPSIDWSPPTSIAIPFFICAEASLNFVISPEEIVTPLKAESIVSKAIFTSEEPFVNEDDFPFKVFKASLIVFIPSFNFPAPLLRVSAPSFRSLAPLSNSLTASCNSVILSERLLVSTLSY